MHQDASGRFNAYHPSCDPPEKRLYFLYTETLSKAKGPGASTGVFYLERMWRQGRRVLIELTVSRTFSGFPGAQARRNDLCVPRGACGVGDASNDQEVPDLHGRVSCRAGVS